MKSFSDYNPITTAVYFLAVAGIAMFSMNPVILLLSLVGSFTVFSLEKSRGELKTHLFSLALFFIMALINPLVSHNGVTVLFVMNDNPVTLEALIYGICASAMIISVLYWFRSFTFIMTSDKLLYLFGALSPKLSLVLSMALRYVPLFKNQIKKINNTQKALGLYKEDNIIDSFRGGLRVSSVMASWALENGIITADSMTARGYGTGKRSRFSLFRFRWEDTVLLCASVVLSALTMAGLYNVQFEYYPAVVFPQASALQALGYTAYGLLAFLPVICYIKEALKWRYLKSKI